MCPLAEVLRSKGLTVQGSDMSESVTVKRLRDKLEDAPSRPRFLKTVYGIGYTWAVDRS